MTSVEKDIRRLLDGDLESSLLNVLDGQASDSEFASLIACLRDSQELRQRACLFLCDESLLSDEIGATQQASRLVEMISLKKHEKEHVANRERPAISKLIPFRIVDLINGNGLAVAALALLIVLGLIAQNVVMMSKLSRLHALVVQGNTPAEVEVVTTPSDRRANSTRESESSKVVGRVIGIHKVQWHQNQKELTFGDSLVEGQRLQIKSGGMEVLLANGAKVTVEGPVDFEVTSLVTMTLDLGKVVAAVPRTARGYTIMTPTTEVVDIGTQFGLSVDESGDTELHVFDGDVVARSLVGEEESALIHAKENEAISFDLLNPEPRRFAVREADFTRQLGPKFSDSDYPPIPITTDLSLWYAADMIPGAVAGEAISTWRDILIGDNKFANDARQFESNRRPIYTTDEQGRSALHFDGSSTNLLIDPIESRGSCTVFVVCAPQKKNSYDAFHGGLLYKRGEAPSLELSLLPNLSVRGWLWPGPNEARVGIVQSAPLSTSRPSVVTYRYDSADSRTQLFINGVEQAAADASVELPHLAHACLGGSCETGIESYYIGKIFEVVAYDGSLDYQSMANLNSYFEKRYSIDLSQ